MTFGCSKATPGSAPVVQRPFRINQPLHTRALLFAVVIGMVLVSRRSAMQANGRHIEIHLSHGTSTDHAPAAGGGLNESSVLCRRWI